jgi:raffinose/stachyose/melibiose transport system substrate-binding protein
MKKIRAIFFLVSIFAAIFLLSSCSRKSRTVSEKTESDASTPITLRVYAGYGDDDERAMYDYAAAAMKEMMPNVIIDLEIDPRDDHQRLKTQAATGNLPDVFPLTADLADLFKKSNSVLILDSYVEQYGVLDILTESAAKVIRDSDGHVYSIPNQQPTTGIIYTNTALFEDNGIKIPQNYEEMLTAVTQFRQKNIVPLGIFANEKWPGITLYDMILTRKEPSGYTKLQDGTMSITDAVFLEAAKKEVELIKAGLVSSNCFAQGYDDVFSLFAAGELPMFINGSWDCRIVGDRLGEKAGILLPNVFADAGKKETAWAMSGGGGPIPGNAAASTGKYPDLAAEFCIKFSLKMTEARTVKQGTMNMVLKQCAPPEMVYNSLQKKFSEISGNFTSMSIYAWDITNQKLKVALEDNCQELLTGQILPEVFISNVERGLR